MTDWRATTEENPDGHVRLGVSRVITDTDLAVGDAYHPLVLDIECHRAGEIVVHALRSQAARAGSATSHRRGSRGYGHRIPGARAPGYTTSPLRGWVRDRPNVRTHGR